MCLLCTNSVVAPDACAHVSRPGGKVLAARARSHRDDRVLVTLEHNLRVARSGVPELDTTVLGAGHDPLSIRSQCNAENKVLEEKVSLDTSRSHAC